MRAVKSAISQTYERIEVIIVDDTQGQAENVFNIYAYDTRIKYYISPGNGANAARNYGISKSHGEYIALLDDDDEFAKDKIERQLKYCITKKCDFVYGQARIIRRSGEVEITKQKYKPITNYMLAIYNPFSLPTTLIRRKCFITVGMFDESLNIVQDWDLWYRISKYFKIRALSGIVCIVHQEHGMNTIGGDNSKYRIGLNKFLIRHGESMTFAQRQLYRFKHKSVMRGDRKTIAIILQPYLTPYRIELFNRMQTSQVIIEVLSYDKCEKRRKWNKSKKIYFLHKKLNPISLSTSYERNLRFPNLLKLFYCIISIKPNYIVTSPNIEGMFVALLSKTLKYKTVCWIESTNCTEENASRAKVIFRRIYHSQVSKYAIPGKMTREYLYDNRYTHETDTIQIVLNTVNESFQVRQKKVKQKFRNIGKLIVYYSGSFIKRKGLESLIRIIDSNEIDNKREIELRLYGSGTEVEIPESCNIRQMGFLEGKEYQDQIADSHIFVLPSKLDCNPLTVIEALKSGCILLLSSGVGNYPETVISNGIVFERANEQSLLDSINQIIQKSDDELLKMALDSCNIGKQFTHKNSANAFLQLFS